MPERLVIANTSPLLYLHLVGRLENPGSRWSLWTKLSS
jgi:hypothetical protein